MANGLRSLNQAEQRELNSRMEKKQMKEFMQARRALPVFGLPQGSSTDPVFTDLFPTRTAMLR